MMRRYGRRFYGQRHERTLDSARAILSLVIEALPEVRSAVDFGCGVGTWLSVLQEQGVEELHGLDGPWLNQDLLQIPKPCFRQVDFEEEIRLDRRYDLAISFEVAEHVSAAGAERLVRSLTQAWDFILCSAAIPGQGGKGHVNEQWPVYWARLFEAQGYLALDVIRPAIWDDAEVSQWHRQTTLLFVKRERVSQVKLPSQRGGGLPLAPVHPEIDLTKLREGASVSGSRKLLRRAMTKWLKVGAARPAGQAYAEPKPRGGGCCDDH